MNWLLAALFFLVSCAVAGVLALPLLRRRTRREQDAADMAVYREQLEEVERDIERSLLTKTQAEHLRIEIQRRMLNTAPTAVTQPLNLKSKKTTAALIMIFMPVLAAGLYSYLGSPLLPGRPFAETLAKMAYYRKMADGYQKAIDAGAHDADRWSKKGAAVILANGGRVTAEARRDFQEALKKDPKEPRARFYLGLAEAQNRRFKKAVSMWRALQKDSAPDAPWMNMLQEHIDVYTRESEYAAVQKTP